jgi:lipid II:glycine glycyltransferase (peptidoglycan interpeptide bridge formation enzyme)
MQIVEVGEELKEHWDNFVSNNATDGGLLHSWQWGDFQKTLDRKIIRLGAIDGEGQLQAAVLMVKHELPFEYNYFYVPRGPVINALEIEDFKSLLAEMKNMARGEKSFLIRVDPPWLMSNEKRLLGAGFRKGDSEVQPKCTLMLDLKKSEEELLAGMKQKTRYNIGLAQRKEVKIRISSEISDVESFWQLMKQTSDRDGFHSHGKEHYKKMFEILSQDGTVKLFLAEFDGKVIAANMISFFGKVAIYLHGSSSDMYRELMAPYLLQWEAIKEAKKIGMEKYDFGGMNGKSFHDKKWEGITRFKTGFAPEENITEFIGSHDLVTNPVIFSVYKFVKQVRG